MPHNLRVDIRDITAADYGMLRDLYTESLQANRKGFVQDSASAPLRDIADVCCSFQDNDGAMHGLYADGKLIGFGGLCKHGNDSGRVEVCKLHLKADFQGLGLGRKLLESLLHTARSKGYKTIELHVTATQTAALGLYVRMGFMQTRREIFTAENGDTFDTIYMERAVDMQVD